MSVRSRAWARSRNIRCRTTLADRRVQTLKISSETSTPLAEGHEAAAARLNDDMVALLQTEDGAEGMMSFVERRPANFAGR
jgi:enoyl-CoA hydratase/carnithine racemase